MSCSFVYFEPAEPEDSNSELVARLALTRSDAEYHSPFILTFEEYMAMDNAPELVI